MNNTKLWMKTRFLMITVLLAIARMFCLQKQLIKVKRKISLMPITHHCNHDENSPLTIPKEITNVNKSRSLHRKTKKAISMIECFLSGANHKFNTVLYQ